MRLGAEAQWARRRGGHRGAASAVGAVGTGARRAPGRSGRRGAAGTGAAVRPSPVAGPPLRLEGAVREPSLPRFKRRCSRARSLEGET